jgi:DNA polymerase/3'-5' exonuclease PolX
MSTCAVSQNQPIVQALLDRAASYPADKPYQAKAYKKAAESVAAYNLNLYEISEIYPDKLPGVGLNIEGFIYDFIDNTPVTAQPVAPVSEPVVVNEPVKACTNPTNQSIYQALIDKGASYPAEKPYQAKAYKKAAEYVASMNESIYDNRGEFYGWWCTPKDSGIGWKIEEFINEFLRANPKPTVPTNPMEAARVFAAQNAPKDVTAWPKDDAARAAFQERVAASKVDEPSRITIDQLRTALGLDTKPLVPAKPAEPKWSIYDYKPVTYTPENPRRSHRLAKKPKPNYFPKEDEQDEIEELIEAICKNKGWEFSEDLITEFNAWMITDAKYGSHKYDYNTNKYVPKPMKELVKDWLMYYSEDIQQQQKQQKRAKAILNYCKKNNIEYTSLMDEKFAQWAADPANKKLISYSLGHAAYDRTAGHCVNKWFSTLKKTVVL